MENQIIGIVISTKLYQAMAKGKLSPIFSFYEEACGENNLIPCFMRFRDLQPGQLKITVLMRDYSGKYTQRLISKPAIIHNRGYQGSKAARKKIKRLQEEGIVIFNKWNQYGKWKIYKILVKNCFIKPHLPETAKLTKENLLKLLLHHHELIIKPNQGTYGKRNMKLTRWSEAELKLKRPAGNLFLEESLSFTEMNEKLELITNGKFIIQERIVLAEYDQKPFDIRVAVQKNRRGEWQVTGMVGKVARTGSFVTNVAKGGTCFPLDKIIGNLPHLQYEQVYHDIEKLSLMIASELGNKLDLVDLGLDIGITNDGFPMLIECNARDLRLTFRHAKLLDIWKTTYRTPIEYGKFLLENRKTIS